MSKFRLLKVAAGILSVTGLLGSCASKAGKPDAQVTDWSKMQQIIDNVKEPVFKDKAYFIADYGAVGNGLFDNTAVFKKVIETCSQNGGGRVVVAAGKYYTGPIELDNNVNLYLEEGAELLFSNDPADYPIVHTSFEGTELMNYSPLIRAYKKTNVAVSGKGTINGQASNEKWWSWSGGASYGWKKGMVSQTEPLNRLRNMGDDGTPVENRIFGNGNYIRPNFVEFFQCKNALIKDIKIVNAPFWVLHPIKSVNVIVDGVTITSHGPNNDGCDPEYCKNVIIRNCSFNTGDDCIAIKSGRDGDGRRVAIPTENVVVQNCKMFDGHGGVTIGSEISAGVRNVYVDNCEMDSPELDRAIRIKSNTRRGGVIENVFVRNIRVGQVKESVLGIDLFYNVHGNQTGNNMPVVRNISLEDVTVKNGGKYGILAKGHKELPIKNITFKNVTIDKVENKYLLQNVENIQLINTKINGSPAELPAK
ncbi:glycoside hydrolase family 28 protein [Flavobacterium sp. Sd200]|uniref:glycoside hydrolase family 28 protein n=1 Tax=Flavobacterium sp. Sd200 TaxID=2692211 RepID=UPI00136ED451|nr:glycoside hydrolase family 28 protein [Flavobacterium sp. Sd200]MXN92528.1 glycoside hydrolase family 28 protein [Flavobacterium sp. Sd200]